MKGHTKNFLMFYRLSPASWVTLLKAFTFIGKIVAVIPASDHAALHYCALVRHKVTALRTSHNKWNAKLCYPLCYHLQMKFVKVMFLHVSVCPHGEWWYPSMHCRFLSMGGWSEHALHAPHSEGKLRGLAWGGGVSRPTSVVSPGPRLGGSPGPHLGGPSPGGCGYPSMHCGRHPLNRWLLL